MQISADLYFINDFYFLIISHTISFCSFTELKNEQRWTLSRKMPLTKAVDTEKFSTYGKRG